MIEGWRDRLRWGQAERRRQQALWETLGVHPQGLERGGFGGHPPNLGDAAKANNEEVALTAEKEGVT